MTHLVLLGDSIFDNASYVSPGEAVVHQMRRRLPRGAEVTLLAVDGAVTTDVERQLRQFPANATHIALSIGGNDTLGARGVLQQSARSAVEVVRMLADIQERFAVAYRRVIHIVAAKKLPTLVCTIYDAIPGLSREEVCALSLFNDVIVREAIRARFALLDLRLVCTESGDYASISPIEPSEQGGAKIAERVLSALEITAAGDAASKVHW